MSLPPLASLFAIHRDDPAALAAVEGDLAASGEFAHVWRPAPGWIAATAPLPGGEADSAAVRAAGLAFGEGRDRIEGPWPAARLDRLGEAAEMADLAPERLGTFSGDFGFARFRAGGAATVVRSCGGLVPFYSWQSGRDLAISTRLGDFVRYLSEEPLLDPLVNAVWTTGYGLFPDRRTFLANVSLLDRGRAAVLQPGRAPAFHAYWRPRVARLPKPTAGTVSEHARRLRTLLVEKLERDLDPEGGNLLTLSGGVDSSSLAALAAGVVGRPVWTWSLLPGPDDLFRREMSYIDPLVNRFGIERCWSVRLRDRAAPIDWLEDAPQVVFHVIHPALCALPAIVREAPVHVLFGGEFADEICGCGGTAPDWAAHTSLLALLGDPSKLPTGPKDILRWMKHRWLNVVGRPALPWPSTLPNFVRPEVKAEYRAWFRRRQTSAAWDLDDRRFLSLCSESNGFVTMNWEAASALGIRRSFPFFSREALELAFECHTSELVGPGTKKLLRAALRGDVPDRNLQRADKGNWGRRIDGEPSRPSEPCPEMMKPIVRDEWDGRRSREIPLSEARGLTQIKRFTESMVARRFGRKAAMTAAPSPSFVLE